MAGRATVTVVVVTHDRPKLLPASLATVAADLGPDDDLMVVESGGSYAHEAVVGLPGRIQVLSMPAAKEKTIKLNAAIRRSTSDVILSTDDDCCVEPGWVRGMAAAFDDPAVGAAFGPIKDLTHVPGGRPAAVLPPGPGPQELWAYAHGASMAMRRRAIVDIGGLDERIGPGASPFPRGEEGDMVLRMRERGWRSDVVDAPAVAHMDWRDDREEAVNVMAYERGAGVYLGLGLRRAPRTTAKLVILRSFYQAELWGDRATRGRWFGARTSAEFARGFVGGFLLRPQRWM